LRKAATAAIKPPREKPELMNFDKPLSRPVRTSGSGGLRIEPKTLGDALDMIDEEVPDILRERPHWRRARNQIIDAAETGSQADIYEATVQLSIALYFEGWVDLQYDR